MTLVELVAALERRAAEADREGATALVANVYRIVLEELRPLLPTDGTAGRPPAATPDRLLTAKQVAEIVSTSERWVYDHAELLGGKRLTRRCVRFPESGVRRYLDRRR